MIKTLNIVIALVLIISAPCRAEVAPNPLTHGNVQMNLKKGVTTQAEVLETFGAPNITTLDADGNELWVYQKHSVSGKDKRFTAIGTAILFTSAGETSGFEQSSKTITLKIKFDASKKVSDFSSISTSF